MISLMPMILFLGLISSLFSDGTEGQFLKKIKNRHLLLHYFEPGKVTDQTDEDCDKHTCKEKICNCCPGYGVRAGNFMSRDTCRRCNCGQLFSCSYTNWDTKTCYCDIGYTDVSGSCIDLESLVLNGSSVRLFIPADCKENPCENGGTCTVEKNKFFCVCREPYEGHLCDKINVITNPEDTTTEITEENTDLVTDDDILTRKEIFENVTSNETLKTTESFENMTSDFTSDLGKTEEINITSSAFTSDTGKTEAVNITSSTTPINETTPTTETITTVSKWTKTALIALSCIVVLLTLVLAYMVYRRKTNR